MSQFMSRALGCVSAIALAVAVADTATAAPPTGEYLSGDFHNHTTCSDGSTSLQTLTNRAATYLDWFIQAGHSGGYNRDCRFDDPNQSHITSGPNASPYANSTPPAPVYWYDTTYSVGVAGIEGNQANGQPMSSQPSNASAFMWRWQSLLQFTYPIVSQIGKDLGKPIFAGMEWVVPGHEHTQVSVITDQYPVDGGNAAGQAQFEYCFASNSEDNSQGGGRGWTCGVNTADNDKLIKRFGTSNGYYGPADYNGALSPQGINTNDQGDHVKSMAGVYWLQENQEGKAFAVPAHLERAGPYISGLNAGYNVENLRDWNNASPNVAFGFESQPGHQASSPRGEYSPTRSTSGVPIASSGLYTFGGTGCYAAAVAGKPGYDVDNVTPLTQADFQPGGKYYVQGVNITADASHITVCQPGLRTMWDALLAEGRKWWFFASSDWHNRGIYGFNDPQTTQDFVPGEYTKTHVFVNHQHVDDPAQDIVNGLRSGNSYVTMGDLISDLDFKACYAGKCATMGETLEIPFGVNVVVTIRFKDPDGANHSPYTFPNPALQQIGITEPLNKPTVRYVDLIKGFIRSKMFTPKQADYSNPQPTLKVQRMAEFTADGPKDKWTTNGEWKEMSYILYKVNQAKYVRIRGSNLPAGTPYERDSQGNPLRDDQASNISCNDAACQPGGVAQHVNGKFDYDVEAWGDLWFYSNPIFITPVSDPSVTQNDTGNNPS